MQIGIIGLGSVGNAIYTVIKEHLSTTPVLIDIDPTKNNGSSSQLEKCDGVYIAVPTPSREDGSCDTRQLEIALYTARKCKGVLISKSTATPNVYLELQKEYPNLIYSPEFLTERNAIEDYRNTKHIICGGNSQVVNIAKNIMSIGLHQLEKIHECSIYEAAIVKYAVNSYLATKVVFMSELKQLSDALEIDWSKLSSLITLDPRVGNTHVNVPGIDGLPGFGGKCFPKDTHALLCYASNMGVDLSILANAIEKNKKLRVK